MITNTMELSSALRQLSSFASMLEALEMDAESKNDWTLFPLVSKAYFHKIREINAEITTYLQDNEELQPDTKIGSLAA
jgi:hypothetical protein